MIFMCTGHYMYQFDELMTLSEHQQPLAWDLAKSIKLTWAAIYTKRKVTWPSLLVQLSVIQILPRKVYCIGYCMYQFDELMTLSKH